MILPLLEERAGVRTDVETNFFPVGILICRLAARPYAAAAGVVFSGQNFCRAQSQNCETEKTRVRPARKNGGDSGAEIELGHMSRRKTYDGEKHLQVLANELARANTHFYFGKKLLENYQQLGAAKDFWDYTLAAHYSIALLNLCRVYDFHKHGINLFNCLKSIDEKVLDQAKRNQLSVYVSECRQKSQNPLVESLRTWRNKITGIP